MKGDLPVSLENINFNSEVFLHVGSETINMKKLEEKSKVHIYNNFAREGGGIANNGIIDFGRK